ncbi:hypothetical protein [Streptomyces sulphureus]|uniref:hypothetical protein n=1 Tax=Streptomyces sulphureus TaxID=47758 RepID=UPI000362CF56|nr:hypothetical protein [Streptomyces sulphureus]
MRTAHTGGRTNSGSTDASSPGGSAGAGGVAALPASSWERPAEHGPFRVHDALVGLHLGSDRAGAPVTLPVLGRRATRIGVLGESLFGRLIASRLVAAGFLVTGATRGPNLWEPLREAAGGRLVLAENQGTWPSRACEPPGVGLGPQALVSDVRRPPPVLLDARWSTAVHVRRQVPRGGFWQSLNAVLALGSSFADAVVPVCGAEAARVTESLTPGEVALFRDGHSRVLRLDIAPAETAMLTPP